ncbi:hypothetical protein BX616_005008 [Lobosporangium transversale]|uniref:Ricin B lectin domain-containing protein n=1 Tax=Lobosporangium transversale TaxID=64571 RepID=A0A1Y2GP88_9FUNG|nr:hypothetical protein BCR41DRAFT_49757 [Lobosporangium transversale]KAF9897770.1 hypothetical protein BX616_005008 [Lobosporangium transversale]ORZ17520.1 hypothetical protein BCR41DRAFT_49757 [Lobosporangium transversale]|eukprot:XP_021881907.1 hypothetical protein BCR41DRAFT_49757 [Lobosporangium transversale]
MNSMHQVTVLLIAILAIISVAIAEPLLPNGYYRIFKGIQHVPSQNRYFTAYPNARAGSVRTEPKDEAKLQVWRLRNHSKGQVSLQIYDKNADKRKYLSEGRSGALPGASLGVTEKAQRWFITKIAGGPFTRYILTHPRKFRNQTLIVSESYPYGEDDDKINWVAFRYQGQSNHTQAWKFARVYPEDE